MPTKQEGRIMELTDNSKKLVKTALDIEEVLAIDSGSVGYTARALVLATMPHSKTVDSTFTRTNGDYTLSITNPHYGLPYGSIPRLLLAWLATEAIKTKSPEIILGSSLSEFMAQLDMVPTGGRWGSITRLKEQSTRLFSSMIQCSYSTNDRDVIKNITIADEADLWWSPKSPNQQSLLNSAVRLSGSFYDEITSNPVPIDLRALKALKKSPMALDVYCWTTHRVSYLKRETCIPWESLQAQFGSGYPMTQQGNRDFKKKFIEAMKKVALVYPELKAESLTTGLILKPSKTHIPKLKT